METLPLASYGLKHPSLFRPPTMISSNCRRFKPTRAKMMCCQGWFDFNSDLSGQSGPQLRLGDSKILSHLEQLGCGEITTKPHNVHFRGCMNESYSIDCTHGKFFVKINRRFNADDMFAGEFKALQNLNATNTIRAPQPLGFGDLRDGGSYIILEHVQFRPFGMVQGKSQEVLGRNLARLHLSDAGTLFGFDRTTRLGPLSLENKWTRSWKTFFIKNRLQERLLRVHAALGDQAAELQSKADKVLERASELLDDHNPKPSILHGDLWMGNTGLTSTGEVAIFDPATFIGDAEFDLAFRGWAPVHGFPGFTDAFYESYHELLTRSPGFEERHNLYQLFHLLNHLLLYGIEYYKDVVLMMDKLL